MRAKEGLQVASSHCANMAESNKDIEWRIVEDIGSVMLSGVLVG